MNAEQILKKYITGDISGKEFESRLYQHTDEFGQYFNAFPIMSGYLQNGILVYLLECDYSTSLGNANAIGAIVDFFNGNGMSCENVTPSHSRLYEELLDVQPKYLDLDLRWLESYYSQFPQWNEPGRKKWLKERIKQDFQYLDKSPKWLQNPQWMIGDNGPLVFVGQLDLKDLYHDTSCLYIFIDPTSQVIQFQIQSL